MTRHRVSSVLVVLFLLSTASSFAKSNLPATNTRASIKAWVQRAAHLVAKNGPSCDAFKSADWMARDYYIFVTGPDERLICHPSATMVGKKSSEIIDANGKKVGELLQVAARRKGGGWTDYVWPRPGQTTPVSKSTYSTRVKSKDGKWYVVGGGGYELK